MYFFFKVACSHSRSSLLSSRMSSSCLSFLSNLIGAIALHSQSVALVWVREVWTWGCRVTLAQKFHLKGKKKEITAVSRSSNRLTGDDVDVGVRVLAQLHAMAVPLKRLAKLLLHCRRATQAIEAHHLDTHTQRQAGHVNRMFAGEQWHSLLTEKPTICFGKAKICFKIWQWTEFYTEYWTSKYGTTAISKIPRAFNM